MKARLPQGMGGGGAANLQQLARQAQKMQEQMEQITTGARSEGIHRGRRRRSRFRNRNGQNGSKEYRHQAGSHRP